MSRPIVEFYYKDDALGDPLLTDDHIDVLRIATKEEANELKEKALKINEVLTEHFCRSRCSLN